MDFLPIFLDIRDRKVIVDGGNTVAARRVKRALLAGAWVHVFNPSLCEEFLPLLENNNLIHHTRPFRAEDVADAIVAYGASEDKARDKLLYDASVQAGVLANVADMNEYCDFITPSVVDRSPLVVAVSSGGTAPIISRVLRARIESLLPPAYGRMAEFLSQFRGRVAEEIQGGRNRRRFWESLIDGPVGDLFLAGKSKAAGSMLVSELEAVAGGTKSTDKGEVYLVGAGPGDPDLLTFRALRLMQRSDVVLYDRLVHPDVLELVRRDAERINVGKLPKQHTMHQGDISALMAKLAAEGKRVLRLKGGDPFIFGRGGEEIESLTEQGISFQVVPGITAASGCSAYAGIPLTHRDYAQSCTIVSAHGKEGVLGLDWEVLLRPNQTVVIYMGLSSLPVLAGEFVARSTNPNLPTAVIENGTLPEQKTIVGTISNITARVEDAGLTGPSMILIGQTIALRDKLNWQSDRQEGGYAMSLQAQEGL